MPQDLPLSEPFTGHQHLTKPMLKISGLLSKKFPFRIMYGYSVISTCLILSGTSNRFKPCGRHPAQSKAIIDIALDHYLQQLVDEPTREANILELFFTNNESLVQHVNVRPGISDHDYIEVLCNVTASRIKVPPRKVFLWKRANSEAISDDISPLNEKLSTSSSYIRSEDVDSMWNQFRLALMESMEKKTSLPEVSRTNTLSLGLTLV